MNFIYHHLILFGPLDIEIKSILNLNLSITIVKCYPGAKKKKKQKQILGFNLWVGDSLKKAQIKIGLDCPNL